MVEHVTQLLRAQLALMQAAAKVLDESRSRVATFEQQLRRLLDYVRTKGYC